MKSLVLLIVMALLCGTLVPVMAQSNCTTHSNALLRQSETQCY